MLTGVQGGRARPCRAPANAGPVVHARSGLFADLTEYLRPRGGSGAEPRHDDYRLWTVAGAFEVLADSAGGDDLGYVWPILRRGFQSGTGMTIIPEFVGLVLALSIYTAAYIAEVVRAGIEAVSHGQTEAAASLGLKPGQVLRFVVIPQALRVIIPPLTNTYLTVFKNSSLAIAIGYPDLVMVSNTTMNQTGQAIEGIAIFMLVYLGMSITISMLMNWYNARVALVER